MWFYSLVWQKRRYVTQITLQSDIKHKLKCWKTWNIWWMRARQKIRWWDRERANRKQPSNKPNEQLQLELYMHFFNQIILNIIFLTVWCSVVKFLGSQCEWSRFFSLLLFVHSFCTSVNMELDVMKMMTNLPLGDNIV